MKKKRHLRKAAYGSENKLSDREKAGLPAGKKISLPINRDNVIFIGILGTDLGPEVKDMPPYRAGICSCTAAPYRFVELLCRKNLLLVFCKETQQREFGPGKACVGIIEICMAVRKIQPQAADGDLTGGLKFFFYFFSIRFWRSRSIWITARNSSKL